MEPDHLAFARVWADLQSRPILATINRARFIRMRYKGGLCDDYGSQQKGLLSSKIKWNFTKFLVNRQGQVVARNAPATEPAKLKTEIERLLKE